MLVTFTSHGLSGTFRWRRQLSLLPRRPQLPRARKSLPQSPRMLKENDTENQAASGRLFSNVDGSDGFRRQLGSELGCAALCTGTTIGAGVLGLPASSAGIGFLGSSATLLVVWTYMVLSGLLIAEVSVQTSCSLGRPSGVSLLGMADAVFGKGIIRTLVGVVYGGLHYAILTAYVAQGGAVTRDVLGLEGPAWLPQILFAGSLGLLLYFGSRKVVESVNNALVLAVVASFCALVFVTGQHLDVVDLLSHNNFKETPKMIPVALVSMVYHNVVGTVSSRLEGDMTKIRRVIIGGTAVPLGMFVIWNAVILSLAGQFKAPVGSIDPLELLRTQGGSTSNFINAFSLLALATSFNGFIYGLVPYINDLRVAIFKEQFNSVSRSEWISFLAATLPPIFIAGTSPDIFHAALDAAGLFFISILFGTYPALMAYQHRYSPEPKSFLPPQVPGGRTLLYIVMVAPLILIASKLTDLKASL